MGFENHDPMRGNTAEISHALCKFAGKMGDAVSKAYKVR